MRRLITYFLLLAMVLMVGCAPMTKESYLEDYNAFIDKVLAEYDSYTDQDWADAEEQMELYRGEYFQKFKSELTNEERAQLIYYEILFAGCRGYDKSADFINGIRQAYNVDQKIEEGFEEAKEYIENDLEDDARKMGERAKESAEKLGEKADEVIKDMTNKSEGLLDELERSIENL